MSAVSFFSQHDEVAAGEENLTVAVSPALPPQFTSSGIDGGKDPFIEP